MLIIYIKFNEFHYASGKESRKEVNATNKEPRSSAQVLTKSRHANMKEPTPAVAAKMSHSTKTTSAAETAPSKKSSKVPSSRKTVVSILAPPPTQHKPLAAAAEPSPTPEKEQEELVVPEQNSIRRKNRALSGSETAIAELGKKQGTVDERIEIHQGAIDRKALTSQPPALVIKDVARILHILGIDTTLESPYILKCCRRKAKSFIAAELLKKSEAVDGRVEEDDDDLVIDASSASSSGISTSTSAAAAVVRGEDPIYGDASIDNGDEIRFVVEMCRFKNLPGLYIVDIRRVRGNAWAYKFLYHKLIDFLDLGKDNYMQSSK